MEDPRIISALFIFLKMAYYNVLINSKKEIAVLLAVGRGKAEIVGQFLTENILIAILSMFASTALSFETCKSNRFIHYQQIGRKYIQIDRSDCHIRYA